MKILGKWITMAAIVGTMLIPTNSTLAACRTMELKAGSGSRAEVCLDNTYPYFRNPLENMPKHPLPQSPDDRDELPGGPRVHGQSVK